MMSGNVWRMNVSQHRMEKTGPDVARCFNHGRNPRRVTARREVFALSEVGAEMLNNAAQFVSTLDDESSLQPGLFVDELFDLKLECVGLFGGQSDAFLPLWEPALEDD